MDEPVTTGLSIRLGGHLRMWRSSDDVWFRLLLEGFPWRYKLALALLAWLVWVITTPVLINEQKLLECVLFGVDGIFLC